VRYCGQDFDDAVGEIRPISSRFIRNPAEAKVTSEMSVVDVGVYPGVSIPITDCTIA